MNQISGSILTTNLVEQSDTGPTPPETEQGRNRENTTIEHQNKHPGPWQLFYDNSEAGSLPFAHVPFIQNNFWSMCVRSWQDKRCLLLYCCVEAGNPTSLVWFASLFVVFLHFILAVWSQRDVLSLHILGSCWTHVMYSCADKKPTATVFVLLEQPGNLPISGSHSQ